MKKIICLLTLTLILTYTLAACAVSAPQVPAAPDVPSVPEQPAEQPANVPGEPIDLPILTDIDENTLIGVAGSSLSAVRSAAKLLDWGVGTGLDAQEIKEAASVWLSAKGTEEKDLFLQKLGNVDAAYQQLLTDEAPDLLDAAGCGDAAYPWSDGPVDAVEAVMDAAGLR